MSYMETSEPTKTKVFSTLIRPEGKKVHVQLVHSLAQALTLTLNHLANKLQQMTSTLFGLMYLTNGSTLIFNKYTMGSYEYLTR